MEWWPPPVGIIMKSSPEAVIVWAEAGPTAIATITLSATTVNNITIRFFMPLCSPFPPTSTWGAAARRTYSTYLVIRTAGVGGLRTLGPERTSQNTYLLGSSANKRCWSSCALFLDLVSGRSHSETWEGCIVSPTAPTKWRSSARDRGGRSRGGTTIPGSLGGRDSARDSDRLPQGRL